jgi:acyl carrier protein
MVDEVRTFIIERLRQMQYDMNGVSGVTSLGPAGLDLESLAVADLMVQVEQRYGFAVDDDAMERVAMMTIDGIAEEVVDRAGLEARNSSV